MIEQVIFALCFGNPKTNRYCKLGFIGLLDKIELVASAVFSGVAFCIAGWSIYCVYKDEVKWPLPPI